MCLYWQCVPHFCVCESVNRPWSCERCGQCTHNAHSEHMSFFWKGKKLQRSICTSLQTNVASVFHSGRRKIVTRFDRLLRQSCTVPCVFIVWPCAASRAVKSFCSKSCMCSQRSMITSSTLSSSVIADAMSAGSQCLTCCCLRSL